MTHEVDITERSAAAKDLRDLSNEISGVETGRQKRFLVSGLDPISQEEREKKEEEERRHQTMLQMVLDSDPLYRKLYFQVTEKIEKARQAVNEALLDIEERLAASGRKLLKMREDAAQLEDGTKVFRSEKDNSIYTEDGKRLSAEEARKINVPANAPSWESYNEAKREHKKLERDKKDVKTYEREVIHHHERRLRDHDNPLTREELKEIEREIDGTMPEVVRKGFDADKQRVSATKSSAISVAHEMVHPTEMDIPDLGGTFNTASATREAAVPRQMQLAMKQGMVAST